MFQNLSSRRRRPFLLLSCAFSFIFTDSPRVLISQLKTQSSVEVGQEWKHFDYPEDSGSILSYSYRVVCDPYYYGSQCSDMCKPRDDKFGHYTCTANGTKLCLDGWGGQFCDKGKQHLLFEINMVTFTSVGVAGYQVKFSLWWSQFQ